MSKLRALLNLTIGLLIAGSVHAQIDSVSFTIDTLGAPILRVEFNGLGYQGTVPSYFTIADTAEYNFKWTFNGVTSSEITPSVTHVFQNLGPHTVIFEVVYKFDTSTYADTSSITLNDGLRIPNVFTPTNEDGVNDLFIIRSRGDFLLNVLIYSKNGVLVYEQTAPVIVWDGLWNAQSISNKTESKYYRPGVYYYILTSPDGVIDPRKGIIYLY